MQVYFPKYYLIFIKYSKTNDMHLDR